MKVKTRDIFQSVLIDISEGGAGVRCGLNDLSLLSQKEVVVLGLMIPGMGKVLIKSEIVRIKLEQAHQSDVGFFAVRFLNPPENITEIIDELLIKGEAAEIEPDDAIDEDSNNDSNNDAGSDTE